MKFHAILDYHSHMLIADIEDKREIRLVLGVAIVLKARCYGGGVGERMGFIIKMVE